MTRTHTLEKIDGKEGVHPLGSYSSLGFRALVDFDRWMNGGDEGVALRTTSGLFLARILHGKEHLITVADGTPEIAPVPSDAVGQITVGECLHSIEVDGNRLVILGMAADQEVPSVGIGLPDSEYHCLLVTNTIPGLPTYYPE